MKTKLILSAFALALTIGLSAQNNQSSASDKQVKTEQTENTKKQQREFPSEKMNHLGNKQKLQYWFRL